MREQIQSLEELKNRGLYIIQEEDVVVNNHIMEIIKEKGLLVSDLAKLTGISRQNINAVVKNKMKPGIDFALKVAFVLDLSVEKIFTLTENAWVRPYKRERDSTLYIDMVNLVIVDNTTKREEINKTGHEYYDVKTQRYLTKKRRDELVRNYIDTGLDLKTEELKREFSEMTTNQINSLAIEELKKEFSQRYLRIYKKLGERIVPYTMTQSKEGD